MIKNIIRLLDAAARSYGDKTAIRDENNEISFTRLSDLSRLIARELTRRGLGGRGLCVLAEQNVFTPVIYLGVVRAGGFYIPLDPEAPEEKLNKLVTDCESPAVLCWAPHDGRPDAGCVPLVDMCDSADAKAPCPDSDSSASIDADTPLYMIYTSGSTGEPKGILKTHGAVLSFIDTYRELFSFSADDTLGNQTPFFFDASAKDIYMMLGAGCTLDIIPRKLFSAPVRLIEYLNERRITVISWVPSALSIVSRLNTFKTVRPTTLRKIMFVGEVFQKKQLDIWRSACPEPEYVNLYGSSEIAGVFCYHIINGETPEQLPMGKAMPNCTVRLVASDGSVITQPGVTGEIYAASDALACCYYKNEEKTRASFAVMQLGDSTPRRYFKTGDLAQYDVNGDLVFSARADFQIKHMGHRIELGEIEAAAEDLPGVISAACLYQRSREAICLFCQADGLDSSAAAAQLRRRLPAYMLPKRYFFIDEMPLTRSGKKDRMALEREYLG